MVSLWYPRQHVMVDRNEPTTNSKPGVPSSIRMDQLKEGMRWSHCHLLILGKQLLGKLSCSVPKKLLYFHWLPVSVAKERRMEIFNTC